MKYGIVILAAGTSARLGTSKQLLQYKGDSLLNNAIKTATAVTDTVVVVSNETLKADVAVAVNPQYKEGMASSIRCGVQYMMDKADHVVLMVCDQPHVNAAHILALIEKQQGTGAKIVASFYANRKGVPALFDSSIFPELLKLTGDVGARNIIEQYDAAVVPFPLGVIDIDTEEAYKALIDPDKITKGP